MTDRILVDLDLMQLFKILILLAFLAFYSSQITLFFLSKQDDFSVNFPSFFQIFFQPVYKIIRQEGTEIILLTQEINVGEKESFTYSNRVSRDQVKKILKFMFQFQYPLAYFFQQTALFDDDALIDFIESLKLSKDVSQPEVNLRFFLFSSCELLELVGQRVYCLDLGQSQLEQQLNISFPTNSVQGNFPFLLMVAYFLFPLTQGQDEQMWLHTSIVQELLLSDIWRAIQISNEATLYEAPFYVVIYLLFVKGFPIFSSCSSYNDQLFLSLKNQQDLQLLRKKWSGWSMMDSYEQTQRYYIDRMKIGENVLSKIEKLLTEIDRPKASRQRTPRVQQDQSEIPQVYNKLYEQHKAKQKRRQAKLQQQQSDENARCSPFKVTNKHSLFLNSQQSKRPLHQRIEEIQNRKMEGIMLLKERYQPREVQEEQENQQIIKLMEQRRRNQRKYTPKQAAEKVEQLQQKERQRMERLNRLKIKTIEEHSKQYRCKPYVRKQTQTLWNRYKLKKQLSSSVFQRFEQYELDRKTHLQNKERQLRQQNTPFAPRISENSRLMASRSNSRLDTRGKTLDRSASCRCFQRGKKHNTSTALHTSRKI